MDRREFFYGKQCLERMKKWDEEQKALNEKYHDFLKNRPSRFEPNNPDVHDQLQYHYILQWEGTISKLGFLKDTDLPQHIQSDIIETFEKVCE